jgi:hypothetical protein
MARNKSLPIYPNQTKKCDKPRAGARSGDPEHHVPEPGLLSRGTQGHGPDLPGDTRNYRCNYNNLQQGFLDPALLNSSLGSRPFVTSDPDPGV